MRKLRVSKPVLFATLALAAIGLTIWLVLTRLGGVEDETWARIQQEGLMRVGMDASWPPFEYMDHDGQIVGFDVDLARAIGQRLGVEVELVNVGFDSLYDALYVGRFDAIVSALPYDPLLLGDVAYSISYFNAGQVLVVSKSANQQISKVNDLSGKRLGVEWGSEGDVVGRRLQKETEGLSLQSYLTPDAVLRALTNGEVDAAIVDAVSAYQFIAAEGGVQVVGDPLTDELYVIAVRLDSPLLLKAINEALVEMREDDTLERLQEKWFRVSVHVPGTFIGFLRATGLQAR
ncbi:MAG: transporter substrate-binding domain-containing protein [Chloroflexi bacterium]|nr:transporter substrate-binding domain-containing protein [Chloroflexota bacterium]